jgi:hypothetical protein
MSAATRLLLVAPLLVVAAACGSDGDGDAEVTEVTADPVAPSATEPGASDDADADEADDAAEAEADESADEAIAPSASGGSATLTLANGETFEFPNLLCTLEPQMAAGSEILFTATSYDDPGLDITQFGDEGTVTGLATISVYDGDYESLWEANSMFGSEVQLTLEGSTIRGTGSFLPGPDLVGEPVDGDVVANC